MSEPNIKNLLGTMPTTVVVQLLVAVFTLGGIWVEFKEMNKKQEEIELKIEYLNETKASFNDLKVVDSRLDKKIKVMKDQDSRIRKLECN